MNKSDIKKALCSEEILKANINLIKAAPELLSALKICVSELNQYSLANEPGSDSDNARINAIKKGINAINKAKGELK
jgi:hypothetical protein